MRTLDGRDDTLHASQLITSIDSLIVLDGEHMASASCGKVGVHRTDAWVIQSRTDGKGFLDLSIVGLHHKGTSTMDDSLCTTVHRGSSIVGVDAMTSSLSEINLYAVIVDIMIDGTCSITSTTHTSDEIVRIITSYLLLQLPFQFLTDDALHLSHNVWVRMRSHGGTYDIEGILWMAAPVTDCLGTSITQSHVTCANRIHLGAQHLHALHVGMLALHVGSTHEDFALHVHQCTNGSSGNTMLSGTCLGDDTSLAHLLRHQNLTDGIVNLVRTRMVEVLTLQIQLAAILLAHTLGIIKR